jgi:site-specific recombinase XerD
MRFTEQHGLHRNTFLNYKQELAARTDLAVSTKNKLLAASRIWLKELNRLGVLPVDITQNVKSFNQGRKHKRDGLNEEEVQVLCQSMQELLNTPQSTRLKAIVALLTLQGLRQIEVARLDVRHLDMAHGVALVQGKGHDDTERVHLHPETVRVMKQYLQHNRIADGPLFTSNSNNSLHQRLTTRSIRNIVQEAFQELGINKNVHGLRHYFTTKLVKEYRGDLLQVAEYTRHRSIEMLQVYFDNVRHEEDLPRYYDTFAGVKF